MDIEFVTVTIYPICEFGYVLPEVAWNIQEKVKEDVERYTVLSSILFMFRLGCWAR